MKLKSFLSGLAGLCVVAGIGTGVALAAAYPINHPRQAEWSFAGPFGKWDLAQLQRGLKVYQEGCAACHSMELVAFRNLEALGYSEEQVKAFAAEYTITDGPNQEGEMFDRPGVPADYFPSPFPNQEAAAFANNGAAPPDFSLIAKARAPERGFPTFVFDIFTLYAENGPDYIYSLLTGYKDAPAGKDVPEGTYYNPYFVGGTALAMAPPLFDEMVSYDDGTPETVEQYAKDVAAFLMWAAEPTLVERKQLGFKVFMFLAIFAALLYLTKKSVFAGLKPVAAGAAGGSVAARSAASAPARPASLMSGTTALRPGVDFIDDVELIDGVGATIAKRLQKEGAGTLTAIAALSDSEMRALAEKVNAGKRYEREEWQIQARDMIAGKPPRAKIDQERVAKLLGKA